MAVLVRRARRECRASRFEPRHPRLRTDALRVFGCAGEQVRHHQPKSSFRKQSSFQWQLRHRLRFRRDRGGLVATPAGRRRTHGGSGFTDETRSLDADDRALLRTVLPHLHRALVLHFRLEALQREHDDLTTCLDELSTGMVLLDTNATVLYANQAALDYLDGRCGLVYENGKLCAPNCNVDQTFHQSLKSATSGQKRSLCGQRSPPERHFASADSAAIAPSCTLRASVSRAPGHQSF